MNTDSFFFFLFFFSPQDEKQSYNGAPPLTQNYYIFLKVTFYFIALIVPLEALASEEGTQDQ